MSVRVCQCLIQTRPLHVLLNAANRLFDVELCSYQPSFLLSQIIQLLLDFLL